MKKILFLITKSNFGGAQRYVFDLAISMKESRYDVAVALGGEGVLKQRLDAVGVRTISISKLDRNVSVSKDAGSLKQIYSIIKDEQPDILHLNSPKAAGLGALAGRILGIESIIYTVHGWTFNEIRPKWQKITIAFFSWITMLFCHKVILLSEKELSQTKSFPFIKNKLTRIPLGIKPTKFFSIEEARKKLSSIICSDISLQTVIGTIAELHPNKGLPYLIEAVAWVIKKYPNTVCIIIGDGQEKSNLQTLIKERRLEKNVFLAGYIDEAPQYLKAFDMFVLPSLKEGLPYVLLEAGLASLPVIATNVGGISEIVEDEKSGLLVAPVNSEQLRKALLYLIENTDERVVLGHALEAHVREKFSPKKMIKLSENCYQKENAG